MRVLLVEDLQIVARIAKFMLNALQCDVDVATSGQEAVEKIFAEHYDLVLMDIGLPDYDGFTITRRIREVFDSLPVYALTAYTDEAHKAQAKSAGMTGFLIKPLDEKDLKRVIFDASQTPSYCPL